MKLYEICNKLHHNILKEPGTLVECIHGSPYYKMEALFKTISSDKYSVVIQNILDNSLLEVTISALFDFKKTT